MLWVWAILVGLDLDAIGSGQLVAAAVMTVVVILFRPRRIHDGGE